MEYKQKLLDLFSYTKRKNKQLSIMVEKKEKYLSMTRAWSSTSRLTTTGSAARHC